MFLYYSISEARSLKRKRHFYLLLQSFSTFLLFHYQRDTTSPPHDCLLDRIYGTDSWTETKATFDIKILRSILINAAFSSAPHIEIH